MSVDESLENLTIRQVEMLDSFIANICSRRLVNTYDKFIEILYEDIDEIIQDIQENPELRKDDGEDRLTIEILTNLKRLGYNVTHDTKVGGHTDLLVKHSKGYKWIGEAKIHHGNEYLWGGFMQLTERYSIGDDYQKDGGILIYLKISDADKVMKNWKNYLDSRNLEDYEYYPCSKNSLYFFSKYKHTKSGLIFTVRHMIVLLYFNPKDNSLTHIPPKRNSRKKAND